MIIVLAQKTLNTDFGFSIVWVIFKSAWLNLSAVPFFSGFLEKYARRKDVASFQKDSKCAAHIFAAVLSLHYFQLFTNRAFRKGIVIEKILKYVRHCQNFAQSDLLWKMFRKACKVSRKFLTRWIDCSAYITWNHFENISESVLVLSLHFPHELYSRMGEIYIRSYSLSH